MEGISINLLNPQIVDTRHPIKLPKHVNSEPLANYKENEISSTFSFRLLL